MDTPLGIDHFAEVIQPNQTAALTIGKVRKWVTVDEKGQPYIGNVVDVTLSCDSRAVEEETAAKFLDLFTKLLGRPQSLLTE
jgi:pyruvate dehydrogenase E2 component (dihydrolipoamide acetyltransferase)